jgi:hypothetical protein
MAGRPCGRPRLYDTPATAAICVRCTPAERLDLARVAADNHVGLSEMIRQAVTEYVAAYDERQASLPRRR